MTLRLILQAAVVCLAIASLPAAPSFQAAAQEAMETVISPDPPEASYRPAATLSPVEMDRLFLLKERIRERWAEGAIAMPGPAGLPTPLARPTEIVEFSAEYPGPANTFKIGRNNKNTNANNAAKGSTLVEPAAANEGARVLAAGNYNHAEYSTNGGTTWTDIVLPGGPTDAPTLCVVTTRSSTISPAGCGFCRRSTSTPVRRMVWCGYSSSARYPPGVVRTPSTRPERPTTF